MKIKAAVCREFGAPLSIEEVSLAEPLAGEVRVTIKACAICHSDITYADGGWGGELPMVLGHEAAGIVESVGSGVTACKVGDRVVVTLIRACGGCHWCSVGDGYLCEASYPRDEQPAIIADNNQALVQGMRTGAFAQAVVIDQSQLVVVPDTVGFDVASLLACGVITGVGAVTNTVRMPSGSHAVVVGCGGVGLNTIQGAHIAGAATITAVDLLQSKLDIALGFGATHSVNPSQADVLSTVHGISNGRGADYVFVTVGAKRAIEDAVTWLAKKGTVVIVGMPPSDVTTDFNPSNLAAYGQSIIGSKMGSAHIRRDIPWLVSLYQQGTLKLDEMISQRYALENINDAIASTKSGSAMRNVVIFD